MAGEAAAPLPRLLPRCQASKRARNEGWLVSTTSCSPLSASWKVTTPASGISTSRASRTHTPTTSWRAVPAGPGHAPGRQAFSGSRRVPPPQSGGPNAGAGAWRRCRQGCRGRILAWWSSPHPRSLRGRPPAAPGGAKALPRSDARCVLRTQSPSPGGLPLAAGPRGRHAPGGVQGATEELVQDAPFPRR